LETAPHPPGEGAARNRPPAIQPADRPDAPEVGSGA